MTIQLIIHISYKLHWFLMLISASPFQLKLMHIEILCSGPPSSTLMQESVLKVIFKIKLFSLISYNAMLQCALCTNVDRFKFIVMLNVIWEKCSAEWWQLKPTSVCWGFWIYPLSNNNINTGSNNKFQYWWLDTNRRRNLRKFINFQFLLHPVQF